MTLLGVLLAERAALLKVLAENPGVHLPVTRSMLATIEQNIAALDPCAPPRLVGPAWPEVARVLLRATTQEDA